MSMTHDEMVAVIQAHKRGEKIQCRAYSEFAWQDIDNPSWDFSCFRYRVAPEPKPDVVRYIHAHVTWGTPQRAADNLCLTFDGETGKLKSAEVLL